MPGGNLAQVTGAPIPIDFLGDQLILEPLVLQDFGTIQNHLAAKRSETLLRAAINASDALPEAKREAFIDKALEKAGRRNRMNPNEVLDFIQHDLEGVALSFHIALEKRYAGKYTMRQVYQQLERLFQDNRQKFEELKQRRDIASGLTAEEANHPRTAGGGPASQKSRRQQKRQRQKERKREKKGANQRPNY